MRFEIERTTAHFGVFNPRVEKNKGPAFDIPFTLTVDAGLLGMLVPALTEAEEDQDNGMTFIDELFNEDGIIKRPAMNPIHINRTPEGVGVTIWDKEDLGDPFELQGCRIKGLTVELKSPHQLTLSGKIQHSLYTDDDLIRVSHIMDKHFDLYLFSEQPDMFGTPDKTEGEAQVDIEDGNVVDAELAELTEADLAEIEEASEGEAEKDTEQSKK